MDAGEDQAGSSTSSNRQSLASIIVGEAHIKIDAGEDQAGSPTSSNGQSLASIIVEEASIKMDAGEDQAGSPTSSNGQPLASIIVDEPVIPTRAVWLNSVSVKEECAKEKPRREEMHKVPALLLANGNSTSIYKPIVVSLGPYHWGNAQLKIFQDRKASMAGRFVPDKKVEASLRHNIRNNIPKLTAGYSQGSKIFDTNEWEEMLFLDGCFVLNFVFCVIYNRVEDLKMKKYEIDSVHHDFFLLENQLPFELLKILSGNDPQLLNLLDEYFYTHKISSNIDWSWEQDEPIHLLDCLRTTIIGRQSETQNSLQALQSTGMTSTVLQHAKELTAEGIRLKPNRSGFLKDIFFKNHLAYGTLMLPRVIVDDSTRPLLLNLAAYEMCAEVGSTITSYICFLNSLVNHTEDIKELQSAGVLVNHLATDEEAANLFNEMAQGLYPHTDTYMDVRRKIQKFSKSKHKIKGTLEFWIAEAYDNHFNTASSALLVAVLGHTLAATQTYFTMFPTGNK